MNEFMKSLPLPEREYTYEYYCNRDSWLLGYENSDMDEFDSFCIKLENQGYELFDENRVKGSVYRTYRKDITVHTYFCPEEKKTRIIADPNVTPYCREPDNIGDCTTTLWQFEVDHSLIDCGMCYIVRCRDGSFFVIDSAHMYSVNDDIRICEFLKKVSGEKKPVVSGWFFSHGHEDHTNKFLDILRYHKNDVKIRAIYYNFPSSSHRDSSAWDTSSKRCMDNFETAIDLNPQIPVIRLHAGQHFYVKNLEFTVLCTHEDVYPASMCDFNNSSVSLKMSAEGTDVLFPGDSAVESDRIIVKRFGDFLKCDVVQVSHHGHTGTSPEFYRLCGAPCALFPVTSIKFDEEFPRQESNRVAVDISKEYYIASNGTVEIDLPYVYGNTKVWPDETREDWNGVKELWGYEYTDEVKEASFRNPERCWH